MAIHERPDHDHHTQTCAHSGHLTDDTPPKHQRQLATFEDVMGAPANRVILSMNASGDDIPHQEPEHRIALPGVGLKRQNIPVQILDPFGSGKMSHLNCKVETRTFVPAERRGIHTSRIGRLVAESTEKVYPDLQAYAADLATAMSDAEYGISSEVSVAGTLSYLEEVKGWKQEKDKVSLEHLGLHARVYADRGHQVEHAGLSINHITACPCVQQTYKHALLQAKGDVHAALETVAPLLTHSQRCSTTIEVKNLAMSLPVRPMLEALDEVLYRVQNTLPREYELLLVYRAHAAPQFIEDAVRQILARLYDLLADESPESSISLSSVSMESIHDFDIAAEIELSIAQLGETLGR